jgi:hypothetical protein
VYFTALSRRIVATWRIRVRSKEASTGSSGGKYSTATLPPATARAAFAASAATLRLLQDRHHALPGSLWLFQTPVFEHPGVAGDGRERGPKLVAGVGGEASLVRECLLTAGKCGLQAPEKIVYGGCQAADLVFGVGDRQASREVALGDLSGGSNDGIDGGEGGPGQKVRTTYGEQKGGQNAADQKDGEGLQGPCRRLVRPARLHHAG